jgi:hypothetical protein
MLPCGAWNELSSLGEAFVQSVSILEGVFSLTDAATWKAASAFQSFGVDQEMARKRIALKMESEIKTMVEGGIKRRECRGNQVIIKMPKEQVMRHTIPAFSISNLYPSLPYWSDGPVNDSKRILVPFAYGVLFAFKELYSERLHPHVKRLESRDSVEQARLESDADNRFAMLENIKSCLTEREIEHLTLAIQVKFGSAIRELSQEFGVPDSWQSDLNAVELPKQFEVRKRLAELVAKNGWSVLIGEKQIDLPKAYVEAQPIRELDLAESMWAKAFNAAGLAGIPHGKAWSRTDSSLAIGKQ